jgi:hypothetical protein
MIYPDTRRRGVEAEMGRIGRAALGREGVRRWGMGGCMAGLGT